METNEIAVFILTHGRPDRVHTYKMLKDQNFSGRIVLVVDDGDKELERYRQRYGEEVVVFSKQDIRERFDQGDNFDNMKTIFYARNACFDIAERLGIKYFFQFDDDYKAIEYRFNSDLEYILERKVKDLDKLFAVILKFYKNARAVKSIALAQSGDFLGGKRGIYGKKIMLTRKCMNTFLMSTDRRFEFVGRINEDVNTYTSRGAVGDLFLTLNFVAIKQAPTQKQRGGMTDVYLESGTYLKSIYTVLWCPSSVKISLMGPRRRIHHRIFWDYAVPEIIREES